MFLSGVMAALKPIVCVAVLLIVVKCVQANTADVSVCTIATLKNLGCYRDSRRRTMVYLNRLDSDLLHLPGQHSKVIQRCGQAAQRRGYKVFGVQHDFECWSSPIAERTYQSLGAANNCAGTGRGGTWANQIYRVPDAPVGGVFPVRFRSLGCFRDTHNRAIPTLEGKDRILDGVYYHRTEAFRKCYEAARRRGYRVFGLQHSGWCASSATAGITYRKYGPAKNCGNDGEGGTWSNEVYEIIQ